MKSYFLYITFLYEIYSNISMIRTSMAHVLWQSQIRF